MRIPVLRADRLNDQPEVNRTMKLAEALIQRADLQTRIRQLEQRLGRNARVQEGDRPAEDPGRLLTEFEDATSELEELIRKINHTNIEVEIEPGLSLTDALASRDVLRMKASAYRNLVDEATISQDRYSRSELKFVSTVEVAVIQKMADGYSRQCREIDARIQMKNWQADLV